MWTLRALALLALAVAAPACGGSGTTISPGAMSCELGPLAAGSAALALCNLGVTGCPMVKPMNALSLVSVSSCVYATGSTPCTPVPTTCPLVNPNGNSALAFTTSSDRCADAVRVLVQASGDGGAGIEWRVQERNETAQGCVPSVPERVGVADVDGACCARTIDVPLETAPQTFRFTVRTDWRRP